MVAEMIGLRPEATALIDETTPLDIATAAYVAMAGAEGAWDARRPQRHHFRTLREFQRAYACWEPNAILTGREVERLRVVVERIERRNER